MSTNPFSTGPQQPFQPIQLDQRVGFGPRLGAFVIDILASTLFSLGLAAVLMSIGVGETASIRETLNQVLTLYKTLGIPTDVFDSIQQWVGAWMLAAIIGSISYSLIEGLTGASPGKRILKIYIARADQSTASLATLLARWAVKNISSITTFVAITPSLGFIDTIGSVLGFVVFIGFFFILSNNRQALHDMIAQTAVFYR